MLYYKGSLNLNEGKFVGIVGTRKATEAGKDICRNIITDLSERAGNITIVSGLAYGVDICAHKASVDCNTATVGVLGHGLDEVRRRVALLVDVVRQRGDVGDRRAGLLGDGEGETFHGRQIGDVEVFFHNHALFFSLSRIIS